MKRIALLLGLAACSERPAETSIEIAGCLHVDESCVIDPEKGSSLSIFVEELRTTPSITLDGETVEARTIEHPAGLRVELKLARGGALVLETAKTRTVIQISERTVARPEDLEDSRRARAALRDTELESAVELFDRTVSRHLASGARADAIRDLQVAAYALVSIGHRPTEANAFLDRAEPLLEGHAESRALQAYFRALVARSEGELRRTLRLLAEAKTRFDRLGLAAMIAGVEEIEAATLEELGHTGEAQVLLMKLAEKGSGPPCERARRMNNVAWTGLLAAHHEERAPDALTQSALEEAMRGYELPECRALPGREFVFLHAALAAVLQGELERAKSLLEETKERQPGLEAELWRLEIAARIALEERRAADALSALDRAVSRARATLAFDAVWRLETLRGRAQLLAGQRERARIALQNAENALDEGVLRLAVIEGRGVFLADRSASARALASLLLEDERAADAACVLRRSHARPLLRAAGALAVARLEETRHRAWARVAAELKEQRKQLAERTASAWSLPRDEQAQHQRESERLAGVLRDQVNAALAGIERSEPAPSCQQLRAPAPDELLMIFELSSSGALSIALDEKGARAHAFGSVPKNAAEWIAPFGAELTRAKRLRIIAASELEDVPFHETSTKSAVYTLDLPARPLRATERFDALVAADPTRNLAGARKEGKLTRGLLEKAGWRVHLIEGSEVTHTALISGLESNTLFHYAGHATANHPGPSDRLLLHEAELYAEDILALAKAPRLVVLAGCSTAAPKASNIGLAQAFLLAGADTVIASTEAVGDEAGERLATALYRDTNTSELDLAARLTGTRSFKVWVP
jgi:hypothetical protein